MGLEELEGGVKVLAEQQGPEELFMPLSPGDDAEIWQDIVNLRLRQKGIYSRWEPRAGTKLLDGALDDIDGGFILSVEAFKTTISSQSYAFLIIHTTAGAAYHFDLKANVLKTIVHGVGGPDDAFSQDKPIRILQSGRMVYLFDPDTQRNRVYDIVSEQVSPWMGSTPGAVGNPQFVLADPLKPYPEKNIFGFRPGAGVIVMPWRAQLEPDTYLQIFRDRFTNTSISFWMFLQADENREHIITSTGDTLRDTGYYFIPTGVGIKSSSEKGSANFVVTAERPAAKLVQAKPLFGAYRSNSMADSVDEILKVRRGVITGFLDDDDPDDVFTPIRPMITIRDTGVEYAPFGRFRNSSDSITLNTMVLPDRPDLKSVLDMTPRIEARSDGTLSIAPGFRTPFLSRAYALLNVLADGSYSLPGPPVVVNMASSQIFTSNGAIVGVTMNIPAAPEGVSSRILISTRWQLEEDSLFVPTSEEYPAGRWFISASIGKESINDYEDYNSDDDLLTELSSEIPMAGGIPLLFAPGEVQPVSVSQHKASLFLGGYDIHRQIPEVGKTLITHFSGYSASTEKSLHVYFEYSNGDTSELVNIGGMPISEGMTAPTIDPYIRFVGLNALINKVFVLANDDTDYYEIASFDKASPKFLGHIVLIPRDADTGGLSVHTPPSQNNRTVSLRDHLMVAITGQQVQIDSQVSLSTSSEIKAVVPLSFDQDKSSMRFRALVHTDKDLQVGYITEQPVAGRTLIQGDFETVFSGMGTSDGNGTRRVGDVVYLSGDRGVYGIPVSISGQIGEPTLVLDSHRYAEAGNPLRSVAYLEKEGEVWFFFQASSDVFVWSGPGVVRKYNFLGSSAGFPGPATYLDGSIYGGFSRLFNPGSVVQYDGDLYTNDHTGDPVTATATTRHILSPREQVRLLTLGVTGRGVDVHPEIDLQPQRRRESEVAWNPVFTSHTSLPAHPATMWERLWNIRRQAITPRLRLNFSFGAGGEVHGVRLRYVPIRNTGTPNLK